jgi:Tfp pilus assembly protein PilE
MAFYHLPMSNIHRGFTVIDALFIVAIVATVAAVAVQKHVDCTTQMVEASSSGDDIFVRLAHFLAREHGTPWISNLGGVC